jgi:hypothetical protein
MGRERGKLNIISMKHGYITALTLILISSWIGMANYYIPAADDFLLREKMVDIFKWVFERYEISGIRRSFVFLVNGPICAAPEFLTNVILFFIHYICTILIYFICKEIAMSSAVAFASAAFFGVYPFGYGAITWACGSYIIPHIILFLLSIKLYDYSINNNHSFFYTSIASIALFVSLIIGEHLVLAATFIGLLVLSIYSNIDSWKIIKNKYLYFSFFVVCIYLAGVLITQQSKSLTDPWGEEIKISDLNISTIFSVWFYSYRFIWYFQPLFSSEAILETINQLGYIRIIFGICFFGIACFIFLKPTKCDFGNESEKNRFSFQNFFPFLTIGCMMLGLSFVHAVAGGYSASSRHHYPALLLIAMLFASLNRFLPIDKYLQKYRKIPLLVFVFIGILMTWTTTAIDRYELLTYKALCKAIAEKNIANESIDLTYNPPIYHLWPNMRKLTSHPLDAEWVLNFGTSAYSKSAIWLQSESEKKVLVDRKNDDVKIRVLK